MGDPLCAVLVWVWFIARFFNPLWGSLCVEGVCVTWLMPVGIGERKCDNSSGYNSVLGFSFCDRARVLIYILNNKLFALKYTLKH